MRPSSLPKLALCGHYESEPHAGAAADRGTLMDEYFRATIAETALPTGLPEEDIDNVQWAVKTAYLLADKMPLEAREEFLKISCMGMVGTADLLCADGHWSADLKSGQVRNYREQQAAYALGFMDALFAEEWTVYLIYCDQREVISYRFNYDEAEAIVRSVIAKVSGNEPPTPNEYCGWCAARYTCPARQEQLGIVPAEAMVWEETSSEILRNFINRANVVEDFATKARSILMERMIGGEKVAGCSLVSKAGTKKIPAEAIAANAEMIGVESIIKMYGPMSEAKFRALWLERMPDVPFPEAAIEQMPGSTYIRVTQPKPLK